MVSASKKAWEEQMRQYGYVPFSERVENFFNGAYSLITGTYRFGKKIVTGTWKASKDVYAGGKEVYKVGKKVYDYAKPHVKEAAKTIKEEIKKHNAEQRSKRILTHQQARAKNKLEEMLMAIESSRSPDTSIEFSDVQSESRTYGKHYELSSKIIQDGKYVPTGTMIDLENRKVYGY